MIWSQVLGFVARLQETPVRLNIKIHAVVEFVAKMNENLGAKVLKKVIFGTRRAEPRVLLGALKLGYQTTRPKVCTGAPKKSTFKPSQRLLA